MAKALKDIFTFELQSVGILFIVKQIVLVISIKSSLTFEKSHKCFAVL